MQAIWKKVFSIIIICSVIFLFHVQAIAEQRHGYLVTGKMTLIQIARDVYGDERFWNRIAYVNNIKSPYVLSVGQKLILPFEPRKKLKQKNALAENEIPASPKDLGHDPIPDRNIVEKNDEMIYIVGERAPTLTMVAIENFGNRNKVSTIARWNDLRSDAKLALGQRLIFKQRPTLSQQESDQILSQYWKKLGNNFMGERIATHKVANPNANAAAKFNPPSKPAGGSPTALKNTKPPSESVSDNDVNDVEPVDMGAGPSASSQEARQNPKTGSASSLDATGAPPQKTNPTYSNQNQQNNPSYNNGSTIDSGNSAEQSQYQQNQPTNRNGYQNLNSQGSNSNTGLNAPSIRSAPSVPIAATLAPSMPSLPSISGSTTAAPQPAAPTPPPAAAEVDPELAEIDRAPATPEKEGEPTTDVYWLGDGNIYQINKISTEQKK